MSVISNFIIHKDEKGIYSAVLRDNYFDLFNDRSKVLYRSRDILALESLIEKTGGDASKIDAVMENQLTGPDKVGCVVPERQEEKKAYY